MRVLLDTHALLWWQANDPQLSEAARAAMLDESNAVHVSAASAWENVTKQRIGELPTWLMPRGGFNELVTADGFIHLPVGATHAWRAGSLAWAHRDPFDRMLAAQATSSLKRNSRRGVPVTHTVTCGESSGSTVS